MTVVAACYLSNHSEYSLCQSNVLYFRHTVSEHNYVPWDMLIKMQILLPMLKYTVCCKLNHMKLLQITDRHEEVNPFPQ